MVFKFCLKGRVVSCTLSFEGKHRCKSLPVKPKQTEPINISDLYKIERSIAFAKNHKEKTLKEILEKAC